MPVKNAIRQHYIPQFYLKNFSRKKKNAYYTTVYDLKEKKQFSTSTKNIGLGKKYYIIKNGNQEISFEKFFIPYERNAARSIRKLITRKSLNHISAEDRKNISEFCSIMMTRVPYQREMNKELVDHLKSVVFKSNPSKVESTSGQIEELRLFNDEDIKKVTIQTTINSIKKLTPYFQNMEWTLIFSAENGMFHTSDNPITLDNLYNHSPYGSLGLAKIGIQIFLPLNSNFVLWMYRPEDYYLRNKINVMNAEKENMIYIKSRIVSFASRFLYAEKDCFFIKDNMRSDKILSIYP